MGIWIKWKLFFMPCGISMVLSLKRALEIMHAGHKRKSQRRAYLAAPVPAPKRQRLSLSHPTFVYPVQLPGHFTISFSFFAFEEVR
jgi:hypothetical protein